MTPVLAHVGGGAFEPLQVAGLTLIATAYGLRAISLAREGRPVPTWRLVCFALGMTLIAAAFASPLAHLGGELLLAHMAQHLVMGDIGALLIVLGLTGPVLQPLLAISWLGWLRTLTHPLIALPLWIASLYIWHLPFLYQAALTSEPLHALQHACFIGFGVLMWMPLVGPLPKPAWFGIGGKLGYVLAVRFAGTILGNIFMWSGDVIYPDYASGEDFWDVSPLTDQGIAGVIMTAEGGLVTLGVIAWLFLDWAQQDTERQRLLDLAESQGVPLSEARAGRAAAAGEGPRLEERIKGSAGLSGNRFLYALVFVVGTASLGTEIAAARLMAPFFGASTIVWANTIAVVLVSLSIGYWLGGRLGDRYPRTRELCLVVLAAAALLAVAPFAARPFFDLSTDALDQISAGAFVGSLIGVLFLISVPVVLMGTCSPWAIRLAVPDVEHAGRTAGRLYAISTAGSLLGTMLAALLLIPFIGTQRTFLLFALALALVGAAGLGWRYFAVPAALAGVMAIPVGTVKAAEEDGDRVIYEEETETQYVRVIEEVDGDRRLELNEGIAQHSYYNANGFLTNDYWDGLLVLPFLGHSQPPERMAVLGNAAGTMARGYGHYFPATVIDGVEIDPELAEVGRRFFDMNNPNLTVHNEDARPWLRASDGGYDVIVVDAYRQPYIPFYLTTREFFELTRDRLAPEGMVIVNVGHPEDSDDLDQVVGRTMSEAFPEILRDPIEQTNTLLIGSEAPLSVNRLREARAGLPTDLQQRVDLEAARIGERLPGGEVYTDDRAPVEWLIDRSILGYAAGLRSPRPATRRQTRPAL